MDLLSLSEATATQKAPPLVSAPPTQKAAQQAVPQQNNILLNLSTSPPKQNNTNGVSDDVKIYTYVSTCIHKYIYIPLVSLYILMTPQMQLTSLRVYFFS